MDKNKNAVEQLKEGISVYVDKKLDNIPFDRTFTALITKVSSNNTYSVLLNGVEYNNIRTIGGECYVNETVKVLVPQDNYNNMFILKAIEDAGNYKLYDYTNENDIALVEGELFDCRKYTWEINGNECYFILDNEYYVTDDELYLTKGADIKGAFFVKKKYGYPYDEYVNIYTTGMRRNTKNRSCGYIVNQIDGYIGQSDYSGVKYQYVAFLNCYINTIENNKNKLSVERTRTNFPSDSYDMNWGGQSTITAWGANLTRTDKCGGYLTTNIPIFENIDDANLYINGDKNVLSKAINYKPTDYKEIFSTSILMNEDSKLKVDIEILMDYNSEEYCHNNKNYLKLPYGKNYGYSGFNNNLAFREVFNRFNYSYILNNITNSSATWGFFLESITYSNNKYCLNGILARITNIVLDGYDRNTIKFYVDYGINVSIYDNYQSNTNSMTSAYSNYLYTDKGNHYEISYGQTISNEYIELNLNLKYDNEYNNVDYRHYGQNFTNNSVDFDGGYMKYKNTYTHIGTKYEINNEEYFSGSHNYITKDVPIYHYPLWFYSNAPIYIYDNDNNIVGRFYSADAGDYDLYSPKFELIKRFSENLKIRYKIDNEIIEDKKPKFAISEDGNVLRLMYLLSSEKGGGKSFAIDAGISKGLGIINENNLTVTISGTGLLDQTLWDGNIDIDEEFEMIIPLNPIIVSYDEEVDATIIDRPTIRSKYWGQMLPYTWKQAGDDYIW